MSHLRFLFLFCVVSLLYTGPSSYWVTADDVSRYATSRETIGENSTKQSYRKKWALIVGIDYSEGYDNREKLPRLSNARRDAKALSEKLIAKYGYEPENVMTMLESDATRDQILRELEKFRSADISSDDSVLVFFAGHGARQPDGVVIYPHDVELTNGRATAGMISVHDHILMELKKSQARHSLLILDSCYSGDIFSQGLELQAVAETDDASDIASFQQPGIQVIASCRGWQTAADGGTNGVHSPFASALLRGLEEIPAIDREPPRIWTSRLMKTLEEEFRGMPNGQRPSYRSLAGGLGEFTFFPDFENASFGGHEHGQLLSFAMLQVTSPGVKGNWWFEEMPWFMPSIRERILFRNHHSARSSDYANSVNPAALRKVAQRVERELRNEIQSTTVSIVPSGSSEKVEVTNFQRLQRLRWGHFKKLLNETYPAARLKTLESIEADLLKPENAKLLEATDLHLLAVIQHAIGREQSINSYEEALQAYTEPFASGKEIGKLNQALTALCHADFGDCLKMVGSEPIATVEQFNRALASAGLNPPKAFHIYCLCRQSQAYLQDNRWEDASSRLQLATEVVNKFDKRGYLAAFVHNNDAWSKMIQWNITEAEGSFHNANDVLFPLIISNTAPEVVESSTTIPLSENSPAFHKSADFGAKVAYFHNLHGLAMARRYQGYPQVAASEYRRVIVMIEEALYQIRNVRDKSSERHDIESSLLIRFVNSQERLGDCNLLGEEDGRDLAEAADDYRRAMARVHRLPSSRRVNLRSQLLYKQSLALAIPSPTQDIDLALEMCHEADLLLKENDINSTGLLLALRSLTTPLVEMLAMQTSVARLQQDGDLLSVVATLRSDIHNLRDEVGQSAHRDQLELLMFATKLLILHSNEQSRLRRSEDVELLLSFNRMALNRVSDGKGDHVRLSSQAFLRQYYDTAFLASLSVTPNDAKRLLEIQHEATMGSPYGKVEPVRIADVLHGSTLNPTIAVYVAGDQPYLILDSPSDPGICIELSDICTLQELIETSRDSTRPHLRLPAQIAKLLDSYYLRHENIHHTCIVRYDDPIWNIRYPRPRVAMKPVISQDPENQGSAPDNALGPQVEMRFPFLLPDFLSVERISK